MKKTLFALLALAILTVPAMANYMQDELNKELEVCAQYDGASYWSSYDFLDKAGRFDAEQEGQEARVFRVQNIKYLLSRGARATQEQFACVAMYAASEAQDGLEVLDLFIKGGMDVNTLNAQDETALMLGMKYKAPKLVKLMLERGSDRNFKSPANFNRTAMFFASNSGVDAKAEETVKLLLSSQYDKYGKINVNVQDDFGYTILHHCINPNWFGKATPQMLHIWLKAGAEDLPDHKGKTALDSITDYINGLKNTGAEAYIWDEHIEAQKLLKRHSRQEKILNELKEFALKICQNPEKY